MTNRLELNWKLDGFVGEHRYYCSETPIDIENLPEPKAIFAGDVRTYIDSDCVAGKKYYLRVGAVKNGVEKISDEKSMLFGKEWTPLNIDPKFYGNSDNVLKDSLSRISQLTDLSGNNNHFQQTIDARKPIIQNESIVFDGIDDALVGVNLTKDLFKNTQFAWIFVVTQRSSLDSSALDKSIFASTVGTSNAARFVAQVNTSNSSANSIDFGTRRLDSDAFSNLISSNKSSIDYQMLNFYVDYQSGSKKIIINGSVNATGVVTTGISSNTSSNIPASIGAYYTAANEWLRHANIKIKALIIGNSIMSDTERQKLEGWAAHKYGLTANLPADHPYKILVPTI